jgi:pimeloyl-ACP methyl ester carboxylesterase
MTKQGAHAIPGGISHQWRNNGVVSSPWVSSYVALPDGIRLRVVDWTPQTPSTGIPIVLVHGLASNARLWDGPARCLTNIGHSVIAVDLRGHGHSDKPDHGYSVQEVARDVAHLIENLSASNSKWKRPLVIGQSWGGNIVVEIAAQFSHLIRGIVAVDGGTIDLSHSFAEWEECERTLRPPHLVGMHYDRLRAYIRAAHPDWSEEAIDGQMHNMERRADDTIAPHLTMERHMTILRHLWEDRPADKWPHIEVPVMFTPASKAHDEHTVVKRQQIAHAISQLPRARVEWFEPADHDLHAQFPDRFAAVVDHAISTGFFT